ncbi:MAG: folylpolyglutamate synthase/dihydrofolate synthase family protein [Saprospiraceae bacterium]
MTYQQTLDFLYAQLPMFQRVGAAAFKKDLTNITALMEALGNPHRRFASIHVGGTNGKGSVSHLLSAALQANGWKTGLYTSPHYKDFRERIKVDGAYIDKSFVVAFTNRIQPLLANIQPSFFEITVAMAFEWFAQQQVDIAVIEVGLGGRLDSTNIITPELSVITNISLDHQQFLGDTLPQIAFEKAGIIKPSVPVVIGETQTQTAPVFRDKAADCHAPLLFADSLFQVKPVGADLYHTQYEVWRKQQLYTPALKVALHGPYQALNIQTALAALEWWQQHATNRFLPFDAIEKGWETLRERTRFQGRWQVLAENPLVLVDSAHNEGGLKAILGALKDMPGQLHIVIGVVNDKKLDEVLPLFPSSARYYFAKANIPRGLAATELQQTAALYGLKGKTYTSVRRAFAAAKKAAQSADTVFVGGSIFTVAEVL